MRLARITAQRFDEAMQRSITYRVMRFNELKLCTQHNIHYKQAKPAGNRRWTQRKLKQALEAVAQNYAKSAASQRKSRYLYGWELW